MRIVIVCRKALWGTYKISNNNNNNKKLQQLLHGIDGVRNIADDIIIFGPNHKEHNKALEECLLRLETHGLTLNMGKCKFLKQNLEFFGMIFSTEAVRPDPMQKDFSFILSTQQPLQL